MLWLEEIRQGVVRANQDTNTAQRSKWTEQGTLGGEGCGLSSSPDGQAASLVTSVFLQPLW